MKPFCTKFFAAFLFLCCAFNAKALNDTLTIGRVFNWQIGDTFIYRSSVTIPYSPPITYYDPLTGFTVVNKQISADTITYQLKYFPSGTVANMYANSVDSPITSFVATNPFWGFWWSGCSCDTSSFCSDTSVISVDPVFNNLSKTYTADWSDWSYAGNCTSIIEEKIGLKYARTWVHGNDIPEHGNGLVLVYYSSGTTNWMDSTLYFYNSISDPTPSPTFSLFPNPATDELTITTQGGNSSPFDINIYDVAGRCVLTHKNISQNMAYFKVSHLPPGYYLLKLTDGYQRPATKGFIIAR